MKDTDFGAALVAVAVAAQAEAQDKPMVGIVSISATEANNVRYIAGATKAAEELGWTVNVVDAAGSRGPGQRGDPEFRAGAAPRRSSTWCSPGRRSARGSTPPSRPAFRW